MYFLQKSEETPSTTLTSQVEIELFELSTLTVVEPGKTTGPGASSLMTLPKSKKNEKFELGTCKSLWRLHRPRSLFGWRSSASSSVRSLSWSLGKLLVQELAPF